MRKKTAEQEREKRRKHRMDLAEAAKLRAEATHDFVVEMLQLLDGGGIVFPGVLRLLLLLLLLLLMMMMMMMLMLGWRG